LWQKLKQFAGQLRQTLQNSRHRVFPSITWYTMHKNTMHKTVEIDCLHVTNK